MALAVRCADFEFLVKVLRVLMGPTPAWGAGAIIGGWNPRANTPKSILRTHSHPPTTLLA